MNPPPSPPSTLFFRLLRRLEEGSLVLLLVAMLLLASAQILLRNLFSVTLLWAEPVIRHLVLWSGFIGALIATRQEKHIRIDALLRICPPRLRSLLEAIASLVSGLVCLLLTWFAVEFLRDERAFGTGTLLGLPTYQWQLIFPVTFAGMALRFLRQSFCQGVALLRGNPA